MFVGRRSELAMMERRYRRQGYECVVLYGRRRVGKTALIREFIRDKAAIFFTGMETTAQENLDSFSQCIYDFQGGHGTAPVYPDFQAAFDAITGLAATKKWSWSSTSSRIWLNRIRGFLPCSRSRLTMSGKIGISI